MFSTARSKVAPIGTFAPRAQTKELKRPSSPALARAPRRLARRRRRCDRGSHAETRRTRDA
eukprot:5074711-Pyramimonas_sp.AAC.1